MKVIVGLVRQPDPVHRQTDFVDARDRLGAVGFHLDNAGFVLESLGAVFAE